VRVKFAQIDLRSVSDVTASVTIINGKLQAAHQKEMHNYSLEVIAREGVRNIEKHYRALLRVFKEDKAQAEQALERYQHADKRPNMPLSNEHVFPETTTMTEALEMMTGRREMLL
jgi:hypothetical protein